MLLPKIRVATSPLAWAMALTMTISCGPTTSDDDTGSKDEDTSTFDSEARMAEIEANGGIYVIISIASGDVLLGFDDPSHALYGAAVSIPAAAVSTLPRALLSIEPHQGAAVSTGLGQTLVGPTFDVALVDLNTGDQITLGKPLARVFAPYSLDGFGLSFTDSAVFLGQQVVIFGDALTTTSGRSLHAAPRRIAGAASRFSAFVAFHDSAVAGSGDDDDDDDGTAIPEVDSTETYLSKIDSCNSQGVASNLVRTLEYRLRDADHSTFRFRANTPQAQIVDYQVALSGAALPPPSSVTLDPGGFFPTAFTEFTFVIRCKPSSAPLEEIQHSATGITDPSILTSTDTTGVPERQVLVSDWFTTKTEAGICNGIPCDIHTGWVWLRINPLRVTEETSPSPDTEITEGEFRINSFFPNAKWEVRK